MNNYKKKDRYSELMLKLKNAVESEFYYEAIFIVYAIFEDRTESILRHADISVLKKGNKKLTLYEKLNKIKETDIFHQEYIKKHFTAELIKEINEWRDKRNILIHDLVNVEYNNEEIKELALQGYELIKIVNNKSTLVNKYNDSSLCIHS